MQASMSSISNDGNQDCNPETRQVTKRAPIASLVVPEYSPNLTSNVLAAHTLPCATSHVAKTVRQGSWPKESASVTPSTDDDAWGGPVKFD